MPPTTTTTTTRRRRSSSTASVLQPIQTNINPVPSPQRSPKRSNQPCRRKSESGENGRRRHRRVSFANPIVTNANTLSNPPVVPKSPSNNQHCVQTLPLPDAPHCVALMERDGFDALPKRFSPPKVTPAQGQSYQIALCRSDTDRRSPGYGMFATRNINRGGVILVERAVMVVSTSCFGSCSSIDQLLDPKVRKAVMRLTDVHAGAEPTLEGIIRTNGLEVEIGQRDCQGIFLDSSRINHSCGPNAFYRWDAPSLSITLEAVRPISAGSEITIPYIDCLQPRADRRKQLKTLYNFDCFCKHCDVHWSEPNVSIKSDMNRRKIREFWDRTPSFDNWCESDDPDDALINLHIDALEMRAAEGMESYVYKKHIEIIAMCYGSMKDKDNFICWMERGVAANKEAKPDVAGVFAKWTQDLRTFPAWGCRARAPAH
ncbi:hypothetical protein PQX77_004281 [Marasmius sp. AFHP31]|nr:hypothetical protein PQX77_004281 [Marasmius sp. AFHP31]